ncbi:nuclear transport factor 2 family protein [Prauserella rugosa]|uniref:Uncharacterized protein (TIGR02246 family) n=1 Tax=Prauserella rugosa TaxID=43354 RepID=A0A660CD81_9PSEU|nr:nuclear transport factor 2 family protein [Prauserella rugosa]TWH19673.1 uncharacterized protein (TIGR02246 family) [Prauserella rugosa]
MAAAIDDDLAVRLDRVEAIEEIRRVLHGYGHAFDKRDLPWFLSLWTDDAEWSPGPDTLVRGRDAIRQLTAGLWDTVTASHHWSVNSVIDVDVVGGAATAVTDVHAMAGSAEGWAHTAATYRDTLRRVDGRWRLAKRETDIHRTIPVADPAG